MISLQASWRTVKNAVSSFPGLGDISLEDVQHMSVLCPEVVFLQDTRRYVSYAVDHFSPPCAWNVIYLARMARALAFRLKQMRKLCGCMVDDITRVGQIIDNKPGWTLGRSLHESIVLVAT